MFGSFDLIAVKHNNIRMEQKPLTSLVVAPDNPRSGTAEFMAKLDQSMKEFGDLGCIIENETTGRLLSGNQRTTVGSKYPDSTVVIETVYENPTATGTIAEGYVLINGERYKYRKVRWDELFEITARIASNALHANWDEQLLAQDVNKVITNGDDALSALMGLKQSDILSLKDGGSLGEKPDGELVAKPKEVRYTSADILANAARFCTGENAAYYNVLAQFVEFIKLGE